MPKKRETQVPLEGQKTFEPTPEQREASRKANESFNQSRLDKLNAIADANDEQRKPEMRETDGEVIFDPDEIERKAAAEDAEAKKAAQALQEQGAVDRPVEPEDEREEPGDERVVNGVKHYLTIVNGKERWMTLTELRAHAQKVESADEYLSAASEAVKNSSALAPPKDEPARLGKDELRKLLAAAALGEEEAIDKLASVLLRPSEVTPDVLAQIDQRLSFRTEQAQLESEHRDILDHPYLSRLFRQRLTEMKSEAPNTSLKAAYRTIGKEIREAFPERFQKAPVTAEDKLARKRTLPPPPQSAGRQQVSEAEEPEETVSDTIEKMAKARGQRPKVYGPSGQVS